MHEHSANTSTAQGHTVHSALTRSLLSSSFPPQLLLSALLVALAAAAYFVLGAGASKSASNATSNSAVGQCNSHASARL